MEKMKLINNFLIERFLRETPKQEEISDDNYYRPHLGVETGEALYSSIYDAICRGDHVLLIGPRGCGKSFAARRAINIGEKESKESGEKSFLTPGAQLLVQGNKEFPRDYFFEPEFEFIGKGNNKQGVEVQLRQPPLFLNARTDPKTGQLELKEIKSTESDRIDQITYYNAFFETVDQQEVKRFVVFLDEINRFNDGVLDSLLLLLEEGLVLYQGKAVKVPATVIATMNPPGYDVSARALSPPLMSRFNSVTYLFTAGLDTLRNTILPEAVKEEYEDCGNEKFEDEITRFSACSLAFWGTYKQERPCAVYLSPDSKRLLEYLYNSGTTGFKNDMDFISSVSNYGPDARAVRDWIMASKRYQKDKSNMNPALFEAAERTMANSVANKLVLNFSPEAKPERMSELLYALSRVTRRLFKDDWYKGWMKSKSSNS